MENPEDSTKRNVELMNEFSRVAGYRIDIQKLVAFLYSNNKLLEGEIKETIPFTIISKIIKYL